MTKEERTIQELNAIFAAACEAQQNGRLEEAEKGYLQLLQLFDDAPMLHYNLGLVYYEQGAFEKAAAAFEKGVEVSPEDVDLLFNLALAKRKCGDIQGAMKYYMLVLEREPQSVDALYNLGGCYKDSKEYRAAIDLYKKTLLLEPGHTAANNNIAYLYQVSGESEQAINHYEKVLEKNPDHEAASHMLAALTGKKISSMPDGYVTEVFDNYSERYEQSLVEELEYMVPEKISNIVVLKQGDLWKNKFERGLDLGCGTGLSGEPFVGLVELLDGVDLSSKMVEQARKKEIYNRLVAGNICEYLEETEERYDFFLAADVLAYLGDLEQTFRLLTGRAQKEAVFCFSTETCVEEGFVLRETGRFAHDPGYIEDLAKKTGWEILYSESAPLRREKGAWVRGELWFLGLKCSD